MSHAAVRTLETPAVVRAKMNYLLDTGVKPVNETGGVDGQMRRSTGLADPHWATIEDGRPRRDRFTLEDAGFELVDHPTAMTDFHDRDELAAVYHPEVCRLIAERSGARRVHVFDHTLRTSDEADPGRPQSCASRSARSTTTTPTGPVPSGCAISCRTRPTP